jgi:hypothetical protein
MILLPEDIQTADEWITLSNILSSDGDESLLNQIYFRNKVHIQSVLSRSECDLRKKIRSIPKIYHIDLIRSGEFSLPDILSAIPKGEDRYQFMQSLGKKRYESIQTFDDLFNIVSALPYDYRTEFILGLGEKKYEIIKNNDNVKSIIRHLLRGDAEVFIEDYEKYRDNIRKNSLDCPPMLSSRELHSLNTSLFQNDPFRESRLPRAVILETPFWRRQIPTSRSFMPLSSTPSSQITSLPLEIISDDIENLENELNFGH